MSEIDINLRIRKFLNSALANFYGRDYEKAIENLKAAEVLDQNNPEILYNLGVAYCRQGLHNTSIEYFQKILNLPSGSADIITIYKLLTYSQIIIEKYKEAVNTVKEGLKLSPQDTVLLSMYGYCLEKMNFYNDAIDVFMEIIEIDNENYNAYNSLAYLYAVSGKNLNSALKYAKTALESNPENASYLDTMGYVYLKKGNANLSKNCLTKALSKQPDSEEIKKHINELLKIGK